MKKVMAVALLTMLSNWAAAAEAPLTAVTNVGGSVAASASARGQYCNGCQCCSGVQQRWQCQRRYHRYDGYHRYNRHA